ncbi:MAG TPA: N-acetylmuramic acid 6-phosphate etherase [Thermomicrobiales bacterium]|nr:N-acetylmuramic acid 6-phosphate etherase [Thermomicrobiales bacterium]
MSSSQQAGTTPGTIDLSNIATEQRNPRTAGIDRVDTEEMLRIINAEDARVAGAVEEHIPAIARAVDGIVERIRRGGRLIYIGAGTSGRLGVLDASECPPTFNTPPGLVVGLIAGGDHALRHAVEHVEDQPDAGADALRAIDANENDTVVGIAASGRTPFVLGAIAYANEIGALTVGICNTGNARLSDAVTIPIPVLTGPEVVTGSTRLKAGTGQKLVLNMLSTGAMIRLGKTYGNLMVDLQPTNQKLRVRAIGIVRDAAGIPESEAAEALERADGDVKTAIVSSLLAISPEEAKHRLKTAQGRVRDAVEGGAA